MLNYKQKGVRVSDRFVELSIASFWQIKSVDAKLVFHSTLIRHFKKAQYEQPERIIFLSRRKGLKILELMCQFYSPMYK